MNKYLKKLYLTEVYSDNTGGWLPGEDGAKADTIVRLLGKANVLNNINSILDVGCGAGGILRKVCNSISKDVDALGIDLSTIGIELANSVPISGLQFKALEVDQVSDEFDLVILSHVLEHVNDWERFLEVLSSKTGKYLYINVPLEVNVLSAIRGVSLLDTYKKYGHVHFFDENFVIAYLEDCGFRVLAKDYGEEFLVQNSTVRGRLAKLPRKILGKISRNFAVRIAGGYSLALLLEPPRSEDN